MVYVCHKVGILFQYCEKCEEYKACKALAGQLEVIVENQVAPVLETA